ncbi:serine/threonine protein kinase, partial [Streptosporangium sp. NPDC048865]
GESVPVKQVTVEFGGTSGGTAELRVGDSPKLDDLSVLQKINGVSGKKTFSAETPKKGRYVLVWFTKMPTYQGKYRGQVLDMKVLATK